MHFGGEFRQAQVDDFYQTGQRGTIDFDGSQGPWSTSSNFSGGVAQTPCAALATKTQARRGSRSCPTPHPTFLLWLTSWRDA
jgi:hypothetical protein